MTTDSWMGVSADWSNAADWSGGMPSAASTATIGGPGAFLVTLFGTGAAAALNLTAAGAEFYDAGLLNLGGTLSLQAGTLALAGGEIAGGTLALSGGQFLSTGGTLAGVAVQGVLSLSAPEESLFVTGGLSLAGAGGSGVGSIALTGGYASLDFLGSQTLNNAVVSIGASGALPGQAGAATLAVAAGAGATSAATLTLGSGLWLRGVAGQGQIVVGGAGPAGTGSLPGALVNAGTITASSAGETLTITGGGAFSNQGTIGVSNGATLQIATGSFTNTGTITVAGATLSLGGTFASSLLSGLGAVTLSAGQIQLAGTVQNYGGTLALGTGSRIGASYGALSLTGTIAGGKVADGGGGLSFAGATGVLDGVTYAGALNLSAAGAGVTLTDGAQVTSASGGAGSIADTGSGSALLLRGTETLGAVQIALGSAGAAAVIATTDLWLASTGTTATLGAQTSVVQQGANAAIEALGWSSVPGFGAADTLVNQGMIQAGFAGGQMILGGYGTIINQGAITASGGDTVVISAAQFANTGTLTAAAGGTVLLGQQAGVFGAAPIWSNTGLIAVSGGTLVLGGAFSTGQLGGVSQTGGTISLAGTLANAGATLTLGGSGQAAIQNLSLAGTIAGGTIVDRSGALLASTGGGALLDGVSYQGTLALAGAGTFLRVRDGLAVNGVVDLLGAGAVLDFQGSQTFGQAHVLLGASGTAASLDVAHDPAQSGGSTLVLGSGVSITQAGQLAAIGRQGGTGVAGDMIVNAGTITAGVAGGTLSLGGPGFTNQGQIYVGQGETLAIATQNFANTGSIVVNGGQLSIAGSVTLAELGQVNLANGALSVGGTLDLGQGTLAIGLGSAVGRVVVTGTVSDGTIIDAGLGLAPSGNATLNGVTYDGTLDLSRPFAQLAVSGGITVNSASGGRPGTILVTGAQSRLLATGSETINAVQISLGSASQYYAGQKLAAPEFDAAPGIQLTLGPASVLNLSGTAGTLGNAGYGQWSDSIVNQGQILAATAGTLSLGSTFFTNAGTLGASAGGVLALGDASFLNTGTLSVGAGSAVAVTLYDYYASPVSAPSVFTNGGVIAMQGGILQEPTGNGLFPQVPLLNLAGADIVGSGQIYAEVANSGTIEARGTGLYLAQSLLGTGILQIDSGAILELGVGAPSGQTVSFASSTGTLKLDQPTGFAGTLSGLTSGDVIDLPGVVLTGVGLNSGTLVASTATQNYRFVGTTPLGGELSAGHDAHGGATISFTAQVPGAGSTPALIGVTQPSMLFWASPAGDVFQGLSANLNGAHVSNWGNADSLDITDLNPASATLSALQTPGLDTLTIADGMHTVTVGLTGTYTAAGFHLGRDGHGGTTLSYHG